MRGQAELGRGKVSNSKSASQIVHLSGLVILFFLSFLKKNKRSVVQGKKVGNGRGITMGEWERDYVSDVEMGERLRK